MQLLTVAEISRRLMVNYTTVRRWIASGDLRAVRLPKNIIRVRESDLDEFVERCTIKPLKVDLAARLSRKERTMLRWNLRLIDIDRPIKLLK